MSISRSLIRRNGLLLRAKSEFREHLLWRRLDSPSSSCSKLSREILLTPPLFRHTSRAKPAPSSPSSRKILKLRWRMILDCHLEGSLSKKPKKILSYLLRFKLSQLIIRKFRFLSMRDFSKLILITQSLSNLWTESWIHLILHWKTTFQWRFLLSRTTAVATLQSSCKTGVKDKIRIRVVTKSKKNQRTLLRSLTS